MRCPHFCPGAQSLIEASLPLLICRQTVAIPTSSSAAAFWGVTTTGWGKCGLVHNIL